MSFTSEVKDELARVMPACPQCEKATLAALVRIEGTLFVSGPARYRVEIATDAPASARLVVRLLHGIYSLKTNLTMRRSVPVSYTHLSWFQFVPNSNNPSGSRVKQQITTVEAALLWASRNVPPVSGKSPWRFGP